MRKLSQLITLLAFIVGLFIAVPAGFAAQPVSTEYRLKAVFLYNFTRFTEWPSGIPGNGDTLNICVTGTNPFGTALDEIRGKIANQASIDIKLFGSDALFSGCQLLFIADSRRVKIREILRELDGQPVLTVADTKDFNRLGGIIQFKVIDKKIRFSINIDAAQRAGLAISSKLLRLATIFHEASSSSK